MGTVILMKQLQEIIRVFHQTQLEGQRAAIATVVQTEGAAYRRPGARMLITASGQMVGGISGGCLEADVFERAQPLMLEDGAVKLVRYDTRPDEDLLWGLGTGCKGVVDVLIESLSTELAKSQVDFIAQCLALRQAGVIATVFYTEGKSGFQVGDRFCWSEDRRLANKMADSRQIAPVLADLDRVFAARKNQVISYEDENGLAKVFFEIIHPPMPLLVFGGGYDAIPLVELAKYLGWDVTVIDPRPAYANRDRFPLVDRVIAGHPPELLAQINLTPSSGAVVMTHHYHHDKAFLSDLISSPLFYLGVLGQKQRTQQLLADIEAEGILFNPQQIHKLYYPVGLDIGAETPEEIALAIVAEIQAVLANRSGSCLRDRPGPIHA